MMRNSKNVWEVRTFENGVDLFDTITMAISFYEGMYNIQLAIQKSTTDSYWKYRCMKDAISSFIQKMDNDSFVGNEEMSFHTFRYELSAISKVEGNGRDEEKDSSNNPLFSHVGMTSSCSHHIGIACMMLSHLHCDIIAITCES